MPTIDGSSTEQHLSLHDLRTIAADIKDTLEAAITDLRHDIQAIAGRVQEVERATTSQHQAIRLIHQQVDTHTLQMRAMQRHMEDLDKQGRRHNLRLRSLPKTVEIDQLIPTVMGLYNNLLGMPSTTEIDMEHIHRALRPKGRHSDPPRDVLCCLTDYRLKEEILRKARNRTQLSHGGNSEDLPAPICHHSTAPSRPPSPAIIL